MMRIANGLQTFALRLRFFFWSLFFVCGIVFTIQTVTETSPDHGWFGGAHMHGPGRMARALLAALSGPGPGSLCSL
jgi:hypothetical protein